MQESLNIYKSLRRKILMSIGLLGTKIGMTRIFSTNGISIPVTLLKVGPCIITQVKNIESDGYDAIQIGYLQTKPDLLSKGQIGHLQKASAPPLKHLKEYKNNQFEQKQIGEILTINLFKIGEYVHVSGKSIGKGFSGYQKKHNFKRGPMSHGSKNHRQPGSIGAGTTPGRVFRGKRMAGRLGNNQIYIKNLQILDINYEQHLMIVKGSVPGKPGNLINIHCI